MVMIFGADDMVPMFTLRSWRMVKVLFDERVPELAPDEVHATSIVWLEPVLKSRWAVPVSVLQKKETSVVGLMLFDIITVVVPEAPYAPI